MLIFADVDYSIEISKQIDEQTVDDRYERKYVRSTNVILQELEQGSEYLLEVENFA
jgi:hypothetical protein